MGASIAVNLLGDLSCLPKFDLIIEQRADFAFLVDRCIVAFGFGFFFCDVCFFLLGGGAFSKRCIGLAINARQVVVFDLSNILLDHRLCGDHFFFGGFLAIGENGGRFRQGARPEVNSRLN